MSDIDPSFIYHKLALDPSVSSIVQKKRKLGEESQWSIAEEIEELLEARFIKEVPYTAWLENVVMVKKTLGKWRMRVDFTDFNKASPKDSCPLSNINRLVDGAFVYRYLSLMDAYSEYNQIRMYLNDEEKIAFITENANFY